MDVDDVKNRRCKESIPGDEIPCAQVWVISGRGGSQLTGLMGPFLIGALQRLTAYRRAAGVSGQRILAAGCEQGAGFARSEGGRSVGVWNPWVMMALSWQLMTTGVFAGGGTMAVPLGGIWRMDPVTLRDVVVDRRAMIARLGEYPSLERVWALSLLGRDGQAVAEGRVLLAGSADRFRPLLVLAHACRRSHRWHEAALLHEEALRLASSPAREALTRYIGVRFFDEALYRDAAAELGWAYDLYRAAGRERLARLCRPALERVRGALAASPVPDYRPILGGKGPPANSEQGCAPRSRVNNTPESPRLGCAGPGVPWSGDSSAAQD
jgi:hypothetical protein